MLRLGNFPNKLTGIFGGCLCAFCCGAVPTSALADAVSIGAHAFWYRGPVRSMALAGATVAETLGGSMVDNPAAMGFQNSFLSSTFSYGEPLDQSISTPTSVSLSQKFQMVGATIMPFDFFSLGATYQTLNFKSENKPDTNRTLNYSDDISEIDFAIAYKVLKNVSIGGGISNADSAREIDLSLEDGSRFSAQTRASGSTTLKAGIQSQIGKTLSLGAFYREHSKFTLAQSGEQSLEFFDSSYHPQVLQLGLVYRPFVGARKSGPFSMQNFAFAAQIDRYAFPSLPGDGKIYCGPGVVFGALDSFEISTKDAYIPRIGMELPVITTWIFSTYTRVGSYYEPSYLKSGKPRFHATAGALVRFWYLAFEGAVDAASNYRNWNYGVGLDFELR